MDFAWKGRSRVIHISYDNLASQSTWNKMNKELNYNISGKNKIWMLITTFWKDCFLQISSFGKYSIFSANRYCLRLYFFSRDKLTSQRSSQLEEFYLGTLLIIKNNRFQCEHVFISALTVVNGYIKCPETLATKTYLSQTILILPLSTVFDEYERGFKPYICISLQ